MQITSARRAQWVEHLGASEQIFQSPASCSAFLFGARRKICWKQSTSAGSREALAALIPLAVFPKSPILATMELKAVA